MENNFDNSTVRKLPADPGAMVLGIISIVIILTGCCCGILAIPVLIMAIIGWVWAAKSKKAYLENPQAYVPKSYSNVNTGLIMNMICTILVGVLLIIGLVLQGASLFNPETYFDEWEKRQIGSEVEEYEEDGVSDEIDTWEYQESVDSIQVNDETLEVEDYEGYNDSI